MLRTQTLAIAAMAAAIVAAAGCGRSSGVGDANAVEAPPATAKAACGPGSHPETGMQGRVSQADYDSGLAAQGINCNTEMIGSYVVPNPVGSVTGGAGPFADPVGVVGGYKVERYIDSQGHECAYYDTTLVFPLNAGDAMAGVNVLDMTDPAKPVLATRLLTPAMLSPHESLNISAKRGLLVAVLGNPLFYPGAIDVYDLNEDCRKPTLKSIAGVGFLGHESGMAPDGNTFYSASSWLETLTPVDISNPSLPIPLGVIPVSSHGLTLSEDGTRAYVAESDNVPNDFQGTNHTGLTIVDVSDFQARKPNPQGRIISRLSWAPMSSPQVAIPLTIKGRPYVFEIDEFGAGKGVGAARIIDIGDETKPFVLSNLRLEVHNPENFAAIADDPAADNVLGGYAGHYCNVPTRKDPKIVACSMISSGLRIFNIEDPAHPREVAYFYAPVHDRFVTVLAPASNFAMSSPAFVPERKEIWYSDAYNGFYAVRVTNGAWPD